MKFDAKKLAHAAIDARKNSYCPYSGFAVGAALLDSTGNIFTGCNIENAAHSPGVCAERTAVYNAISAGTRDFIAIAIAGGKMEEQPPLSPCPPCGVCRQVLAEFCGPENFKILLVQDENHMEEYTLSELLPLSFGPTHIDKP